MRSDGCHERKRSASPERSEERNEHWSKRITALKHERDINRSQGARRYYPHDYLDDIPRAKRRRDEEYDHDKKTNRSNREAPLSQQTEWRREMVYTHANAGNILKLFAAEGHRFSIRNLVIAAHRFAQYGGKCQGGRLNALVGACQARLREFEARELANAAWGFARAGVKNQTLFDAIANAALTKLNDCTAEELASLARAFARADIQAPLLFNAIAIAARKILTDFSSAQINIIVSAFAKLSIEAPLLFHEIATLTLTKLADFSPRSLSGTLWAFSAVDIETSSFFEAISQTIVFDFHKYTPTNLAVTARAFATAKIDAPRFFHTIAKTASMRVNDFEPKDFVNFLWAFATARIEAPKFFYKIAHAGLTKLPSFHPHQLGITAWAFATAGIVAPDLFASIAEHAHPRISQFSSEFLVKTAWAFATTSIEAPTLFQAIAQTAKTQLTGFTLQELITLAWAFAISNSKDSSLLTLITDKVSLKLDSLNDDDLSLLYFVGLHFQLAFPNETYPLADSQHRLRSAYLRQKVAPSQMQRDVAHALDRIGWSYLFEYRSLIGLNIDLAQPETKMAIVIDSPPTFLKRDDLRLAKGEASFESRLLRESGWTVIHIPNFEWETLLDATAQETYLAAKLQPERLKTS